MEFTKQVFPPLYNNRIRHLREKGRGQVCAVILHCSLTLGSWSVGVGTLAELRVWDDALQSSRGATLEVTLLLWLMAALGWNFRLGLT